MGVYGYVVFSKMEAIGLRFIDGLILNDCLAELKLHYGDRYFKNAGGRHTAAGVILFVDHA
jgi:hypothetical protein